MSGLSNRTQAIGVSGLQHTLQKHALIFIALRGAKSNWEFKPMKSLAFASILKKAWYAQIAHNLSNLSSYKNLDVQPIM